MLGKNHFFRLLRKINLVNGWGGGIGGKGAETGKKIKLYHSHMYGEPFYEVWAQSKDFRLFLLLRSLRTVSLLFGEGEKNFETMGKVAMVYKYENCHLSFKTIIQVPRMKTQWVISRDGGSVLFSPIPIQAFMGSRERCGYYLCIYYY